MKTITVFGHSDDLINIDSQDKNLSNEFYINKDELSADTIILKINLKQGSCFYLYSFLTANACWAICPIFNENEYDMIGDKVHIEFSKPKNNYSICLNITADIKSIERVWSIGQ